MRKILLISLALLVAVVAVAATIVGSNGTFTTSVSGTTITTTYTPQAGAPTCNSIYMVQTCRDTDQAGNPIEPKDYVGGVFKHLQDDMTPGGTYVDHLACEKDPYYNGEDEGKDTESEGSDGASSSTPTTMDDTPNYGDEIFPNGVSSITSTFEVCAICKDDGRILDCYTWTYTRTKGDGTNGTVTSGTTIGNPSPEFRAAKAKFEKNHQNGEVCPDVVAETNAGTGNASSGGITTDPEAPLPDMPFQLACDIVNLGGVEIVDVQYQLWLDSVPFTEGMVPVIESFDFETVMIEMPPLPVGPHELMLVIDPFDTLIEYDEEDNLDHLFFEIQEPSASPVAIEKGIYLQMLKPNPTHGEFQVMLRLESDSDARLSVYDLRGRVVQTRVLQGNSDLLRTESFRLDPDLGAGVYFLRLEQNGKSETRKFIMLR